MGNISTKVEKSEIKEGDHIYTYRAANSYSHHGIYVGGSKVVHYTARRKEISGSGTTVNTYEELSNPPSSCPNFPDCGFHKPDNGVVLICLDCFLRNGSLYRYEYGVTPSVFLAEVRGGTCTIAKSDPPEKVIDRAMYLLQNGFGNYDVFRNNCEDFALYCKTEFLVTDRAKVGRSGQASSVIGAPLAVLLSLSLILLVPIPVRVATVTTGLFCMSRYAMDIGIRSDVVKVPAEDVAVNLGWGEIDGKNGEKMRAPKSNLSTDIGVWSDVLELAAEYLAVNLGWGEIDEKNGEKMRALKSKLSTDTRVWNDVLKVTAEDLAVNLGWGEIDEKNGEKMRALKSKLLEVAAENLAMNLGWGKIDEKNGEKMRALKSKLLKLAAEDLAVNLGWGEIDEKNGEIMRALKSKLSTDIGVWSNVLKVAAECLAVNLGREEIDGKKNGEKMRALKSKLLEAAAEDLAVNLGWGEIDEKNGEKMRALKSELSVQVT